MTVLIIVQLLLQITLKGSIDDLWNFFLILQMIAFLSLYEATIPANIEIYFDEFRKLVKFEILKPDNMLGLISPGLTVAKLLGEKPTVISASLESSGVQSTSIMANLGVYILGVSFFIIVIVVLVLLLRVQRIRDKVKGIIEKIKKKTFWNNTIRSVTISYLETALSLHI